MASVSNVDNLSPASSDKLEISSLKIEYIPREYISPDPEQIRKHFSQEHIERLRDSFKEIGIRTPLDVVKQDASGDGTPRYKIIDGECRYRASEGVLDTLPCIVFGDDSTATEWALSANMMRDDLNPIEKSDVLARFMERNKDSKDKITLRNAAKKYHLSPSMLSEYHSLSKLDNKIKEEQRKSGQIPLRELKKLAVKKLRENPEEQRRKYDALKKKYPTEEERAQRESQKSVAKKKDKDAPNKIRAKHIEGMKTRPESDLVYYSQIKFDDFSPDELKTARENLAAAKERYQEIIQILDDLQQKIDIQKAKEAEKSKAS